MQNKKKAASDIAFLRLIICMGVLFLFHCAACYAQQVPYSFRHINQSDGLLHTNVKSVVQDNKGFIWILTPNGLQRYDGSRFVTYPYDLNNPAGIFDTREAQLFADKTRNCLWMTYGEIQKLDLKKNKFTSYNPENILQDTTHKFESYTDVSGSAWVAGHFGIFHYDKSEKKMIYDILTPSFLAPNKSNFFFTDTHNQNIWFVEFWKGLSLFQKKTKKIYTHSYNPIHDPLLQVMDKKRLTGILMDSKNNFWISTADQVFYRYNSISNKLFTYSLADIKKTKAANLNQDVILNVKSFFEDNHHNIWVATENAGLLQYNRQKDSFTSIGNEEQNTQGLHYNFIIWCIFQDDEENIWLGTDKGINIFNPYRDHFQSVHHQENNIYSLPENELQDFIQTKSGDILAGTWGGGITVFDSNFIFKKNISFSRPFEYNLIWSFIQNDDGNIWAGCQHGYIHIYNPATKTVSTIHPPETNNKTIRCMAKDRAGNIWMGLHDGKIAKWDKEQKRFYGYNDSIKGITQIFAPAINIFFDSKGFCWVSTNNGFKKFDTQKRIYSASYLPDKTNTSTLSANNTEGVEEYNDSTLLIGTAYGGLNFFNTSNETFTRLTAKNGLPANTIHSIKKDTEGFIWFTTDYDLYKFNAVDKKFIRYNIAPGILNAEFKPVHFYTLRNGNWLAATATEIISFNPKNNISKKNSAAKVEITGFKIFDHAVPIDSLLDAGQPVHLSYKQNFLTIEFAQLNFSNMQQMDYSYLLDGVNKEWVNAGSKNYASYTNLSPGAYTFSVKADDGSKMLQSTSFKIIIDPPFYKTWWFVFITGSFLIFIIYRFIKWRVKSIRAVGAEKLKVQQLNAEQYKNNLEHEKIVNYFSSSLIDKAIVDDVLWDVAKNLIGRLGFVDCMIYLWNDDKTKMIQKAGFGPKGSVEEINKQHFDVLPGQGVVGYVMETKEAVLIKDTSKDIRYRSDEMIRSSEITVPVIYNNELVGVIDSEHHEKNFFTAQHLQILNTIATLMATKIRSIEAEGFLQRTRIEMYSMNEQLSKARLEALRSQMNPHFIFNCINSIDALIQSNDKYNATVYLNKFAKLIRGILDSSKQNTISLANDLDTLKLYIQLEQFRHEDKFTAEIKADDELLQDDYKVPPLIIQPFVENAILHGLRYRNDHNGRLCISVRRQGGYLQYVVEDNGVGRNTFNTHLQKNKVSYGIDMSNERVKLFNNEEKTSVQITDLFSNGSPSGTKVEVYLKVDEC